ncbi:MAG TPA: hypothetical protein VGX28_15760 [Frankiaceae bacterium]|nr:hypothetical protein [Frankiaceae bacterium]
MRPGLLLLLSRDQPDGAAQVTPPPIVGADGTFTVTWTIPPSLGEVMNHGGGPTTPGAYYFRTKPATPGCTVAFTVT